MSINTLIIKKSGYCLTSINPLEFHLDSISPEYKTIRQLFSQYVSLHLDTPAAAPRRSTLRVGHSATWSVRSLFENGAYRSHHIRSTDMMYIDTPVDRKRSVERPVSPAPQIARIPPGYHVSSTTSTPSALSTGSIR